MIRQAFVAGGCGRRWVWMREGEASGTAHCLSNISGEADLKGCNVRQGIQKQTAKHKTMRHGKVNSITTTTLGGITP